VIAEQGLPRMWRRPEADRGGPAREVQARAEAADFTALPGRAETRLAGLFLAIPDLIALGVPDLAAAAGYPPAGKIPALSYLLSLLALKLTSTRRVSHVYDIAADPGAALFAGLTALPKATALTTYSYRLEHARQAAFLTAVDKAAITAGLATGDALNLDFHAVMHWGDDPVLEKHYVPRRSQRTRSVLTFFAEDAGTHTLLYANADLSKATQNREVIAFADHWHQVTGHDPALLIFDSKLTTQAVLAELDDRKIGFITLRARHPGITKTLAALPASAWKPMTLGRAGGKTRRVRMHDDPAATLSAYPRPIRQLAAGTRLPIREALDRLLDNHLPDLLTAAIDAPAGRLPDLLDRALQLAPQPDLAAQLADQMPEHSVQLAALAAALTSQQVTHYQAGVAHGELDAASDLAMSLNNLAASLADLGRREDALAAIEEAVGIRRDLAARWPDVYQHELEQSLRLVAWLEQEEDLSNASPPEPKT
jgi:Tetratricopeptide repeat